MGNNTNDKPAGAPASTTPVAGPSSLGNEVKPDPNVSAATTRGTESTLSRDADKEREESVQSAAQRKRAEERRQLTEEKARLQRRNEETHDPRDVVSRVQTGVLDPSRTFETSGNAKLPSKYVIVQSKTGRGFNRAGFRFEAEYGTPVDLSKLTEGDAMELANEYHLAVSFVDQETFERKLLEFNTGHQARNGGLDAPRGSADAQLRRENDALIEENDQLRNEISLLRGRLNNPGTGSSSGGGPLGG